MGQPSVAEWALANPAGRDALLALAERAKEVESMARVETDALRNQVQMIEMRRSMTPAPGDRLLLTNTPVFTAFVGRDLAWSVKGRLGNIRLVGMDVKDLQDMYKFYIKDPAVPGGVPIVAMLPDDVILNTRRAFSTSTSSPSGSTSPR